MNQCWCKIGVDNPSSLSVHVVFVTMAACEKRFCTRHWCSWNGNGAFFNGAILWTYVAL